MPKRLIEKKKNGSKVTTGKLYIDRSGQQKITIIRDDRRVNGTEFILTESEDGRKITIEFKDIQL